VPTSCEVPEPTILHLETPSPFTPLGAKGLGEGNNMSTPVCIANAVADALDIKDVTLPLSPSKVMALIGIDEPASQSQSPSQAIGRAPGRGLSASGTIELGATAEAVFQVLNDPDRLAQVIPGCENLAAIGANHYRANVTIKIGVIKVRYRVEVKLSDLDPPHSFMLSGKGISTMGISEGSGHVSLAPREGGATLHYDYSANVSGKVAAIGGRMLEGAAKFVLQQLFEKLGSVAAGNASAGSPKRRWWGKLTGKNDAP
jgi:2-furoyl-CoA dehydrogenase large subunit